MSQNINVNLVPVSYSRTDFTALRAWVQRIPLERIAQIYYTGDAPQVINGLERHLTKMRHDLIERAIVANPYMAEALAKARIGGVITGKILDTLVKAADARPSAPNPSDPISQWFRPRVAQALMGEKLSDLHSLVKLIELRGSNWWKSIPRIGELRARAIEKWLNQTPAIAIDASTQIVRHVSIATSLPLASSPIPLDLIGSLPSPLNGQDGRNRASSFCFIHASNDLEAINVYLDRFRHQQHTFRAYQRELERLLLWAVLVRKTALSSLLVEDCESYKDFLANPLSSFIGPRRGRFTNQWKPFSGRLSSSSQKQAIQIIRTAFAWLVNVRYLGGNPWIAVKDPATEQTLSPIKIERALPSSLWNKTLTRLDELCTTPQAHQLRIGRAAILLLGESGLRRDEAANALCDKLTTTQHDELWKLDVLGKRNKWRMVPVSARTFNAIQSHWSDLQDLNLPSPLDEGPRPAPSRLLNPITTLRTKTSRAKHEEILKGYSAGGLATLVKSTLKKIALSGDFSNDEINKLCLTSAHALRHTFGTISIAEALPIDVLQRIFGHASISTTSIYVQAEHQRTLLAAATLFEQRDEISKITHKKRGG